MKPELNAFDTLLSRLDNENRMTVVSYYDMKELLANLSVGVGELNSFYKPKDNMLATVQRLAVAGDFVKAISVLDDWYDRYIWRLDWHGKMTQEIYSMLSAAVEWSNNLVMDTKMIKVLNSVASILSGEEFSADYGRVVRTLLWMNSTRTEDKARVRLVVSKGLRKEFLDIAGSAYVCPFEKRREVRFAWNRLLSLLSDGFGHKVGVSKADAIRNTVEDIAGYEGYRLVLPTDAMYYLDFWQRYTDARGAKDKPEPSLSAS